MTCPNCEPPPRERYRTPNRLLAIDVLSGWLGTKCGSCGCVLS
jgi:hypothetical protein